ncbi:hypothetical protein VNO77_07751 [Canavalia gladiata]|uniref:Uncharacterized protein n=1 Tax=Canavalia gladiata TaxID=3824 RepID=A0AAN9M9F9_CANGL
MASLEAVLAWHGYMLGNTCSRPCKWFDRRSRGWSLITAIAGVAVYPNSETATWKNNNPCKSWHNMLLGRCACTTWLEHTSDRGVDWYLRSPFEMWCTKPVEWVFVLEVTKKFLVSTGLQRKSLFCMLKRMAKSCMPIKGFTCMETQDFNPKPHALIFTLAWYSLLHMVFIIVYPKLHAAHCIS